MSNHQVVIGERVLLRTDGGPEVTVKLFLPVRDDTGGFRCDYQICGIGKDAIRFGGGVDSIQAIQIALQKIGVDLYIRHKDVQLSLGNVEDISDPDLIGDPYDLGFPRPKFPDDVT